MAVQTIPALKTIPPYPQRKDPQDRFDTLIKEAVDGGAEAVSELNTKFIPNYNSSVDVLNWIDQNRTEILAVDDNAASALASKNAAATSASTATTKAGEASASATAAKASETAALTSKTAAAGSAGTASTKAGEAATSATAAKASETAAATSASTATTKAGEAATSAANALTSKNTAATSAATATTKATEAATSATDANAAKVAAEAARDEAQNIAGGNYVLATRKVTAGTGLSGGGDLTADRTLTVKYGTAAGTACQGNDARLSNARTPTAHAATHGNGGADAITSLGPVAERAQSLGTITGSVTVDLSAGLSVSATIGGATTVSFTNVPTQGTIVVVLMLTNGGNFTVTWPASVIWAGSKAPTLTASGKDMIVLATNDGGVSWWGSSNVGYGAGA